MKKLILTFFLLVLPLSFTAFSYEDVLSPGQQVPSTAIEGQMMNEVIHANEMPAIRGRVVDLDPAKETITITQETTGYDRTFTAQKNDLKGIKPGDKVRVTSQLENPETATYIFKDKS